MDQDEDDLYGDSPSVSTAPSAPALYPTTGGAATVPGLVPPEGDVEEGEEIEEEVEVSDEESVLLPQFTGSGQH